MKTPKERAIDVLTDLITLVEHDRPPPPDHVCGPWSLCDGSCVDAAHYSDVLTEARWVLAFLKKPITRDPDDLEVPGQKVDPYARTPSALREKGEPPLFGGMRGWED